MPLLNNTPDCELTDIEVTGTILYTGGTSIPTQTGLFSQRTVQVGGRVKHVSGLKSNRDTNTVTSAQFFFYSGSIGDTTEADNEYFNTETYRIVSGNYTSQASLTQSANTWNSQTAMNNGGSHDDGMVTANGYLITPLEIGDEGDTRSQAESGLFQAPLGNPDYSLLTNSTRTFYRYFFNDTVNDRNTITVTFYGSGSLVKQATSLGQNGNFYAEVKIPGKTAWLDLGTAYGSNNPLVDGAGALDGADPGNPAVVINSGGRSVTCNFNGQSLLGGANDEHFAIKISADENWLGYLTRIRIQYS